MHRTPDAAGVWPSRRPAHRARPPVGPFSEGRLRLLSKCLTPAILKGKMCLRKQHADISALIRTESQPTFSGSVPRARACGVCGTPAGRGAWAQGQGAGLAPASGRPLYCKALSPRPRCRSPLSDRLVCAEAGLSSLWAKLRFRVQEFK